jgi:hypothetical protein
MIHPVVNALFESRWLCHEIPVAITIVLHFYYWYALNLVVLREYLLTWVDSEL